LMANRRRTNTIELIRWSGFFYRSKLKS